VPDVPARAVADATARLAERYSATAEDYARLWSPVARPMSERLLAAMPLATARRVLDVATGVGGLIVPLRAAAPLASVIGVDRAEGMLRLARQDTGAPAALMDALALAVRSGGVDAVVLAFCLFRLLEPRQGLREARRVLRAGGMAGATTWGAGTPSPADDVWTRELDAWGAEREPDEIIGRHSLVDAPAKLRRLFQSAGFVDVRAWTERFEQRWTPDQFLAIRALCGRSRQRFESLPPGRQDPFRDHVRARLVDLPPSAFTYRPEVVYAIGRRA
jgi:ubiquinone/menaquinone biosynthesis C-methylase UbiE